MWVLSISKKKKKLSKGSLINHTEVSNLSGCFSYLWLSTFVKWSDDSSGWHEAAFPLIKVVSQPNMGMNIREMAFRLPIIKGILQIG